MEVTNVGPISNLHVGPDSNLHDMVLPQPIASDVEVLSPINVDASSHDDSDACLQLAQVMDTTTTSSVLVLPLNEVSLRRFSQS